MLFLHQLTAEPSVTLNTNNISFMKQEGLQATTSTQDVVEKEIKKSNNN